MKIEPNFPAKNFSKAEKRQYLHYFSRVLKKAVTGSNFEFRFVLIKRKLTIVILCSEDVS